MSPSPTPQRHPPRLAGFDYSTTGAYFITVCVAYRETVLSSVVDERAVLSDAGRCVEAAWLSLPGRFVGVALDAFVVMPNHIHGIIVLDKVTGAGKPPTLGWVVRTLKAVSTREVRRLLPEFAWQTNFYEHVIRSEGKLDAIREYILSNPAKWDLDELNPVRSTSGRAQ